MDILATLPTSNTELDMNSCQNGPLSEEWTVDQRPIAHGDSQGREPHRPSRTRTRLPWSGLAWRDREGTAMSSAEQYSDDVWNDRTRRRWKAPRSFTRTTSPAHKYPASVPFCEADKWHGPSEAFPV